MIACTVARPNHDSYLAPWTVPSQVRSTLQYPQLISILSRYSIDRNYSHPDPPLTQLGHQQASNTHTPKPDLILVSPMTRTVQTALIVFDQLLNTSPPKVELQIWPDLREAHDAICNKGVSRVAMAAKFPQFDFAACSEEWDYAPHTVDDAIARAEGVRRRLKHFSLTYKNIMLVTHRGFAAFLVKGMRFDVCGMSPSIYLFNLLDSLICRMSVV